MRLRLLLVGLVTAGLTCAGFVSAPLAAATRSEVRYDYGDAIRERVSVQTGQDTDADGVPDVVVADIIRPKVAPGVKVPVIIQASPYRRGSDSDWDSSGIRQVYAGWLDNYFVPRGYAVAFVDLPGTLRSTGCNDVGGPNEILGTKAFIDWLNGRAEAVNHAGAPAVADWDNGKSAMYGFSWDGATANGVAATGVDGLTTIVPVAGISNWYSFTTGYGRPYIAGLMKALQESVSNDIQGSRPRQPKCDELRNSINSDSADSTGDYRPEYWDTRNYAQAADKFKASVFLVHGLRDLVVKSDQVGPYWEALGRSNVPRKLFLTQGDHSDAFNHSRVTYVRQIHAWFDYWLLGIDNGVMDEPVATVQRDNGSFASFAAWPVASRSTVLPLKGTPSEVSMNYGDGQRPSRRTHKITGGLGNPGDEAVINPAKSDTIRAAFLTRRFADDTQLSGSPTLKLRFRSDSPRIGMMVRLVDYGTAPRMVRVYDNDKKSTCWGAGNERDTGCFPDRIQEVKPTRYSVYSTTKVDLGHYAGLAQRNELDSATWYEISIPLDADDLVVKRGHQLGVILTLERGNLRDQAVETTVWVDSKNSSLTLPSATEIKLTNEPVQDFG